MNSRSSTRFVWAPLCLAAIVGLWTPSAAVAQIQDIQIPTTLFSDYYYDVDLNPLPGTFTYLDLAATDLSAGNVVEMQFNGDWNYKLPRVAGLGSVFTSARMEFSVGNVPVRMSDIGMDVEAKWVNSGGNSTTPETSVAPFGYVLESPDFRFVLVPDLYSYPYDVIGNGLIIVGPDSYPGTPSQFILAPNTIYYVEVDIFTNFYNSTFSIDDPTVTITNEFGGALGDSFDGYRISFAWTPVPEPGTWALASVALAALGAIAWRRRRAKAAWAAA